MRAAVAARAGFRCEYYLLLPRGHVATFRIDHVIPRSSGGPSDLANLALACPHCNAHKWNYVDGEDPESRHSLPLLHPRFDSWAEHFQWSLQSVGLLEAKTARGRVTIARLQMNNPDLIATRRLLAAFGLFPDLTEHRD